METKKLNAKAFLTQTQKIVSDGKAVVDLPRNLQDIHENELWKEWTAPSGKPFDSFGAAIKTAQPYGLGLGQYNGYITVTQAYALCKSYKERKAELLKLAPDDVEAINENGVKGRCDNVTPFTRGSNSAEYLLGRMKRDAAGGNKKAIEALEGIRSGRLTSVRKAAIRCGIVKVADSDSDRCPIKRIKMYWKRANAKQRKELLAWLKSAEAKLS